MTGRRKRLCRTQMKNRSSFAAVDLRTFKRLSDSFQKEIRFNRFIKFTHIKSFVARKLKPTTTTINFAEPLKTAMILRWEWFNPWGANVREFSPFSFTKFHSNAVLFGIRLQKTSIMLLQNTFKFSLDLKFISDDSEYLIRFSRF